MAINMSYCRFENTLAAVRECMNALEDHGNKQDFLNTLSKTERNAALNLFKLFDEYASLAEIQCLLSLT